MKRFVIVLALAGCGKSPATTAVTTDAGPSIDDILAMNAANAADAAAHNKADFEDAVRKGCKLKSTQPVFVVTDADQRVVCHSMVREQRIARDGDMSFPSEAEDKKLYSYDGCTRIYGSWVEGKNAFGVTVRTNYECTLDPKSGKYTVKTH